jgi:Tfp pilus assembly protein PilN
MFKVDLLKGQGLPVRTKPQGVAIFVTTFAVPFLVAIIMVGYYFSNGVIISIQKQNIESFDAQTQRLADDWKFKESSEKEKTAINNCLADVSASIHRHAQWSPVLAVLVENLPDSVVLTSLEVKQQSIKLKAKASAKTDTGKKTDTTTTISVRTLKMRVSGNPTYDCDFEIRKFRDRLRASELLGPKLEDVVIASQGHDVVDGHDVIAYDIDCVFKPGL